MNIVPIQIGLQTNVDVLASFVNVSGKRVVDVGCGSLMFSKILADAGASVLAIDPDIEQAELNRAAELQAGIEFVETSGEAIPAKTSSLDGAVFSYSLHHVPIESHLTVFQEVDRVVGDDGFVYVIEPIDCPFYTVMRHFHNEEAVRKAAWKTLETTASKLFPNVEAVEYHCEVTYATWEEFVDRFGHRSFNPDYSYSDVACETVKQEFERQAIRTEAGFQFSSPKRAVFMRR